MSQRVSLKAMERPGVGRGAAKRSRNEGKVPAVLYGGKEPLSIELDYVEVATVLNHSRSENILVNLEVGERKVLSLIQDTQLDPIKDRLLHVDFYEVQETTTIRAEVPVVSKGDAEGVRNGGGLLDHVLRSLHVECLPKDLPEQIEVDVSDLGLAQSIHVGEVKMPEGTKATNPKDLIVFMVHPPRGARIAAAKAEAKEKEKTKGK